jgi:hypothetical protein
MFSKIQYEHTNSYKLFSVRNGERNRRKSTCVVAKGAGQTGVESEWVGTTWFRILVQKDPLCDSECVEMQLC